MRLLAVFSAALLTFVLPTLSGASVHLMQIEQVICGVEGDAAAQAIQLRMRSSFQNQLQLSQLRAWDADGLNPVVVMDFPAAVTEHGAGVRILVASAGFVDQTNPAALPDFTMTNLIPESYLDAGSLTFEDDLGTIIYWRLSWGGDGYTGPTDGAITNDTDGEFGPVWPDPMPSTDLQALLFQGAAGDGSSNNSDDYALTGSAATFTNNAGEDFLVEGSTSSVEIAGGSAALHLRSLPNPFVEGTHFEFVLPTASHAVLVITDVRGREIATFENDLPAGPNSFEWDGRGGNGKRVATGVYSYRLRVRDADASGRVTVVR